MKENVQKTLCACAMASTPSFPCQLVESKLEQQGKMKATAGASVGVVAEV